MSVIDFRKETGESEGTSEYYSRKDILDADNFSVVLYTHVGNTDSRFHDCSKDEFFYVIEGNVEMQVDNRSIPMKAGNGILIKAGEKHKRKTSDGALIMMITKQPHRHRYYD